MRTTLLAFILASVILSIPQSAYAALEITEIMYNPVGSNTGRQWIEVRNTGNESIDLGSKDIRIHDAKGNHLIKPYTGSAAIPAGGIAVVSNNPDKFREDWPAYTGQLVKSAFSLTSEGSIQVVRTDGSLLSSQEYDSTLGGKNDGNSLNLSKGALVPGAPTPGAYSNIPAAAIAPVTKPSLKEGGSKKQEVTKKTYDSGIIASPTPTTVGVGEALSGPVDWALRLIASAWFSSFLMLLAFSGFSVMLIKRYV